MKTFLTYQKLRTHFFGVAFLIIFSLIFAPFTAIPVEATAGVPSLINFQGRLLDSSGNLLGGPSGTDYCFKFSIYNADTGGSKIWPSGSPTPGALTVREGVFDATVGSADTLDLAFTDDQAYMNVAVSAKSGTCDVGETGESYEDLGPRPQIVSSGFAINSRTVGGFTPAQSATGSQIPALTSDALILGGSGAGVKATGSTALTFQSGVTGDIQFFSGSNKITSAGALTLASTGTMTGLTLTSTPSTSGGGYDILTRNTSTGVIEKISSSSISSSLSGITAAGTDDTDNDNTNYQISWDWSTLTTQRALTLNSTSTGLTTGGILALGSSTTAYNHGAANTGSLATLTFKDTTSGAFASTTNGLLISPTVNITAGAATKIINSISVEPTFTACTTATCNVQGLNIANVTDSGNFASSAIKIGTGWDTIISGTTAGTNLIDFTNFKVSSAGVASALTGLSSSGTITFSAFSTDGGLLYTNGSGVLAQSGAGSTTTVLHGGTTPSYSAVALGTDVSGDLPFSNLTQIAGLSVLGVTGTSTADVAAITGTADQVLRVNSAGTALGFGTIANAGLTNSSITVSTGTSGSDFNVSGSPVSLGGTVTLNIPDAGASARGLVTTGTQTFAGSKTFTGLTNLTGGLRTAASSLNANFVATDTNVALTNASVLVAGAGQIRTRLLTNSNTNQTLSAAEAFTTFIFGTGPVTEATSGVHPLLAQLAIKPLSVTDGTATTTNAATLYIEDATTGITPTSGNYAIWSDAGQNRFDGETLIGTGTDNGAYDFQVNGNSYFSGTLTAASFTTDGGLLYTNGSGVLAQSGAGSTTTVLHGGTTPTYGAIVAADITADSLDFTEFKDTMALDATTVIGFGSSSYNLTFTNNGTGDEIHDLTSTGDFIIKDSGTAIGTFSDAGAITFAPTSGQNLTATLAGAGTLAVTSGVTTGTTTTSGISFSPSALTTGTGLYAVAGNSFTSGKLVDLQVSSTGSLTNQTALNILTTGVNGTGAQTTYGAQIANTHSGTSTNVALYATATGGTNNYAGIFENGEVLVGTASDTGAYALQVNGNSYIAGSLLTTVAGTPSGLADGMIWYDSSATKYKIRENGLTKVLCNTTDAACGAGSGSALSAITAATGNASIDSTNKTISWDWSTLTTERAFTFESTSTGLTTGGILALGSSTTAYAHANGETGSVATLTFKDATVASGAVTSTTNGLLISPTIAATTSTSGTKTINAISVNPTFTSCTGGATCAVNGLNVSNVTDGTGFTTSAITLGTGWDTIISGTTAGTNLIDFTNFKVSSAGVASALTGLSSSGTITFSAFSTDGGLLYTNGSGVLAQSGAGSTTTVLHGGTTPSYSAVALGTDVSGDLPFSNLTQIAGLSVLGVTGTSTADVAAITGTADQVLRVNSAGTALGFGTIANAGLTNSSITVSTGTSGSDFNVSGSPVSLGGTVTLNIPDAGASARGLVTTGTQTFAGSKTFNNTIFGNISTTNPGTSSTFSTVVSSTTNANRLIGGASNTSYQLGSSDGNLTTGANFSYASFLLGTHTIGEASSGTHPIFANLAIKPLVITDATATTTNSATLYLEDAASGATNNYAIWSDSGTNRLDGETLIGTGTDNGAYSLQVAGNSYLAGTVTMTGFSTDGGLLYTNGSGVLAQSGAGSTTTVLHGGTTPTYGAIVAADITADSLDFTEFKDSMAVDATSEINLGAFALTIDLDSTGDFSIRDGTTDVLAVNDSGAITFAPTSGQNLTATLAGAGTLAVTSGVTTGTTTTSGISFSPSALTTGTGLYAVAGNSFTSGKLVDLQVSSTGSLTNQTALNILTTGVNGTGAQTTYGAQIANTHSGTSTNVALYATASSGASNYSAIFDAGTVGIGTTTPNTGVKLEIAGSSESVRLSSTTTADYMSFYRSGSLNGAIGYGSGSTFFTGGVEIADAIVIRAETAMQFGIGNSLKVTLANGGNFGIGDATPASLLTVGASDAFQVNSTGAIVAATGITSTGHYLLTANDSTDSFVDLTSTGDFIIKDSGTAIGTFSDAGAITFAPTSGQNLTATLAGAGTLAVTSGVTTGTTTTSGISFSPSALTTGTGLYAVAGNSFTSGKLVDLQVSSTGSLTNQTALNILTTGVNGTGAQTTYGAQIANTHSGTSTNVALYATATGGTNNYAGIFDAGGVGIGTTAPAANVALDVRISSATAVRFGNPATANGLYLGFDSTNVEGVISADNGITPKPILLNPSGGNIGIGGDLTPDSMLSVGSTSQFQVNSSGVIAAAAGVTSSGTITFSAFTSNGGPLYTNGSGVLAQATAGGSSEVLHGGTTPSFSGVVAGDLTTQGSLTDEYCLTYETGGGALLEWQTCGGAGGANTALSNLASVAINTSLLPASDDSIDLGDNTHRWANLYLGGETLHLGTSTSDEETLSYTTSTNTFAINSMPSTAAALKITDGTNSYFTLNTRTNTSADTALALAVGTAPSIASSASSTYTGLSFTPGTFTFTGTTNSTGTGTSAPLSFLIDQPIVAGDGTRSITEASNTIINGAVKASSSSGTETITKSYGLNILAGAALNGTNGAVTASYGLSVNAPTGATNNYAAIFNGGNVGIGTTAPTSWALEVTGSIMANNSIFALASGSGVYIAGTGIVNPNESGLYNDGDIAIADWNGSSNLYGFGASAIIVDSSNSRVGIGDASPAALLTVGSGDLFQVNSSGAIASVKGITDAGAVGLVLGAAEQLTVVDGVAQTVDMVDFSSSSGTTTNGADVLNIGFTTGNGSNPTNTAVNISLDSGGTVAGDVLNGISLTMASANGSTQNAIVIGANFDKQIDGNGWSVDGSGNISTTGSGTITSAGAITANGGISMGANAITGTTGIIDYTNFDVDATGNITVSPSKGLDTNAAGAIQLGKTNATSVDICNSSSCDTINIGNLATTDADSILIGDSSDTTTITGIANFTGSTTKNVNISNSTLSTGSGALNVTSTSSGNFIPGVDFVHTQTATGSMTSYGLQNGWTSTAVVTGASVGQTIYGIYNAVSKSGADDATGTYNLYGSYNTVDNTGRTDVGTVNTYAGYFTALGDTAGTSTAIGAYFNASGADNNYAAIFNAGNVGIGTTTPTKKLAVSDGVILSNYGTNSTPLELSGATPNVDANTVFVYGKYAYVGLDSDSGSNNEFRIFDVHDPTSVPTAVGGVSLTNGINILSIYVSGNYAYIGTTVDGSGNELRIYDITNPASPSLTGSVDVAEDVTSIMVVGRYLYLTKTDNTGTCSGTTLTGCEFSIYDITNPASPAAIGGEDFVDGGTHYPGNSVYVQGKYAFVGRDTSSGTCSGTTVTGCEFIMYDISNPFDPSPSNGVNIGKDVNSVYVSGKFAYLGIDSGSGNEFSIYNIGDPSSIGSEVGGLEIGANVYSVTNHGKYAYLGAASVSGNDFKIVDVSNTASPSAVGGVDVAIDTNEVFVSGKYLYAALNTVSGNEFRIYDLSGLDAPAATIGALAAGSLNIYDNARIFNDLDVNNAINLGVGGLQSAGSIVINNDMSADSSTAAIAGILENLSFAPSAGGTQVGNRMTISEAPTSSANTSVGQIIRTTDNTSLANTVRGIEIVSSVGTNVAGTNTGLRATGATFGVQGITTGLAGDVTAPAALYGEMQGTTQGDALRLYSTTISSSPQLAYFYQDTSAFSGTGLLMDFATGSGSFSGNFVDFQKNNVSEFKVTNAGDTSVHLAVSTNNFALCHETNGAGVDQIKDCVGAPGADYAELYPMELGAEYGDIMTVGTQMVNTYDTTDGAIDWTKIKGKITKLVKSTAPYQKNIIGIVVDNHGDFTSAGYNIKDTDNPMPIALNGRVPVKVASDSAAIVPGDYLTTSSQPGKATKATGAGQVIGKALETWDPASGAATVMVFVEQGYHDAAAENMFANIGDSVSLNLSATGSFIIKNAQGEQKVLIDKDGNATFAGKITAGEIEASKIKGLDVITDRLSVLGEGQEALSLTASAVQALSQAIGQTNTDLSTLTAGQTDLDQRTSALEQFFDTAAGTFNMNSITANALSVTGDSTFTGQTNFVGLSIFNAAEFTGDVSFNSAPEFKVPPLFNKDTAGFALVKEGDRRVDVTFEQAYVSTPVVTANISFETSDNVDDTAAADLFASGVQFITVNKNINGFTILLNKNAPRDIRFSWIALGVRDPNIFESVFEGLTIDPTPTPEPTPTPTPDNNPTPTPDTTPTPDQTPTPDGTPTPDTTPTPDQTLTPDTTPPLDSTPAPDSTPTP